MHFKSGLNLKVRRETNNGVRKFVNEEWETVKRNFTGSEPSKELTLRTPARAFSMSKRVRGECDVLSLPKETIRQFFTRTWDGIRLLISDQKKEIKKRHGKEPKKILLIGGLGSSRYIYNMLQDQYQNVLQPKRAWSVVARGTVISVLRNTFSSNGFKGPENTKVNQTLYNLPEIAGRVSRLNYGVLSGIPVGEADPPVNPYRDRVTKRFDGSPIVWRMRWYLKQGDTVENKKPVTYDFYQYVRDPVNTKACFRIMISDAPEAPIREDHTVKQLCEIECGLEVPWEELRVVAPGARVIDDISLTMRFQGEPKWSLKVGRRTVELDVDVQYTEGCH